MTDDTTPNDDLERTTFDEVRANAEAEQDQEPEPDEQPSQEQEPMVGETVDLSSDQPEPEENLDYDVEESLRDYYEFKEKQGEPIENNLVESSTEPDDTDETADESDPEPEPEPETTSDTDSDTGTKKRNTGSKSDSSDSDDTNSDETIGEFDPEDPPASFSEIAVDIEDIDVDLDDQDWQLGQPIEPQVIQFRGMYFVLQEPQEDDQLENVLKGIDTDSPLPQRKALTQLIVDRPEITDEKWDDGMTPTERFALSNQALAYLDQGNSTSG